MLKIYIFITTEVYFMIQEKKHRVLIKCIHSHRKVGSNIMSDELKNAIS